MKITSKDNEKLKFARRVRDGKVPDHIFIEGKRLSREALGSKVGIEHVFTTGRFLAADGEMLKLIEIDQIHEISEVLLDSIADTRSPQGIVMIARRPDSIGIAELLKQPADGVLPVWIYLFLVNNPSNLGAVVRTAEAAGAAGLLVSENSADPFSPKAIRASMGSIFRLPVISNMPVSGMLDAARQVGISVAAVDAKGKTDHFDYVWTKPTILVFGSEADGLTDDLIQEMDSTIRIAMDQKVESLNLAVASGIILFEARRANRP